jgi:hypothetical protein
MTSGEKQFSSLNLDRNLMELVKLECALKKHFVYIDNIDELKHKEAVVREFDKAIAIVNNLMNGVKRLRSSI